jgi:CubicO group peptidase (beta-lactamase class C family)
MKIVSLFTLAILLLFQTAFASSRAHKPDHFKPMRELILRRMSQQRIPSISVAVASGNHILWKKSFGWADRENRIPATPDTMYTLGSLSKPMTATAIMLLREKKLLNLDRSINDYLGQAKVVARLGNASDATVKRVAQHNAGLSGYYETFYPDEFSKPPPIEEVIRHYGNLVFPPGERFHHSNLNYAILGYVISRVSGKTYEDFMRAEVFQPLGMSHSCVLICNGLEAYRAKRYFLDGSLLPDYITAHPAAADIYASVNDLVRFGMFQLKAHVADQRSILADSAIDEMQQPAVAMGGSNSYGIGWVVSRDAKGRRRVSHGGAGAGVDTQLTLMPDEKIAVAVLINTNIEGHISGEIADAIINLLLGDKSDKAATPPNNQPTMGSAGLPGQLLGTWKGFVHTYKRDLPVIISFKESVVQAQLDDQPQLLIINARLDNGTFTGRMTATWVRPTQTAVPIT